LFVPMVGARASRVSRSVGIKMRTFRMESPRRLKLSRDEERARASKKHGTDSEDSSEVASKTTLKLRDGG
jgi:hypothetical protein